MGNVEACRFINVWKDAELKMLMDRLIFVSYADFFLVIGSWKETLLHQSTMLV